MQKLMQKIIWMHFFPIQKKRRKKKEENSGLSYRLFTAIFLILLLAELMTYMEL